MATSIQEDTPFCLERLESRVKSINGDEITPGEGRRLLVELVGCFVVVGRQVGRINRKVDLREENDKNNQNDSDLMRSSLKWFVDKVLPTVVSTSIFAFLLWLATVNGHISMP